MIIRSYYFRLVNVTPISYFSIF